MTHATPGRRVALVTGASAGIGKAIVRRLLRDGWTVWAGARRLERMEDIRGEGARVVALDVTREESRRKAAEALLAAEGRLDALVNNAGYGSYGALEDVPLDEAKRQFEVNVFGLMDLTRLFLPAMRAARGGRIVNVSSMGGRVWFPFGGWYHATKHALEVLSDILRMELRPFGVRVIVIEPGAIRSEWSGIAADGLRERSHGSDYGEAAAPWARQLEKESYGADPAVIADVVAKALTARRPRRRYTAPNDARILVLLKRVLPDAAWEAMLRALVR